MTDFAAMPAVGAGRPARRATLVTPESLAAGADGDGGGDGTGHAKRFISADSVTLLSTSAARAVTGGRR